MTEKEKDFQPLMQEALKKLPNGMDTGAVTTSVLIGDTLNQGGDHPDPLLRGRYYLYQQTEKILEEEQVTVTITQETLSYPVIRGVRIVAGVITQINGFGEELTLEKREIAAKRLFQGFLECKRYFKVNLK